MSVMCVMSGDAVCDECEEIDECDECDEWR